MFMNTEKKESIWTRLQVDCDIDELIYDTQVSKEVDENTSDR